MQIDALRNAYNSDPAVTAICDEMASRERNQTETKLTRILARLRNDGRTVRKPDAIAGFRTLEECGCGQYVPGRHGWPSRFVWSVGSLAACQTAQGVDTSVETLPESNEDEELDAEIDTLSHSLQLRVDFDAELQLPTDLTQREAERIAMFVKAIPMED